MVVGQAAKWDLPSGPRLMRTRSRSVLGEGGLGGQFLSHARCVCGKEGQLLGAAPRSVPGSPMTRKVAEDCREGSGGHRRGGLALAPSDGADLQRSLAQPWRRGPERSGQARQAPVYPCVPLTPMCVTFSGLQQTWWEVAASRHKVLRV